MDERETAAREFQSVNPLGRFDTQRPDLVSDRGTEPPCRPSQTDTSTVRDLFRRRAWKRPDINPRRCVKYK